MLDVLKLDEQKKPKGRRAFATLAEPSVIATALAAQKNYEELTATKDSELNTLKATLAKKKEPLGDDTKTMTDSSVENFFSSTRQS